MSRVQPSRRSTIKRHVLDGKTNYCRRCGLSALIIATSPLPQAKVCPMPAVRTMEKAA